MAKQDRLDREQFTYQILKNGNVLIFWHGKQIQTLSGTKAMLLAGDLECVTSDREVQLVLAKITGNFKRGNEKTGRHGATKPRY